MCAEDAGDGFRTVKGGPGKLVIKVIEEARDDADAASGSDVGQGGFMVGFLPI